ncbi:YceD family protein [Allopontixanthobacter sp.]|uniref:YceD family protein n=1 Tax=Allopontixanthobacter sp. TaxID=2906452 RepID=UPI002AB7F5BB|nr:YceD family protein [Allopontixanthobacter sp.]MDZ4306692.1 YceD family protein [Allopontixanthobacter sp.]
MSLPESEFSRIVKLHQITDRPVMVEPGKPELAALARRFGLAAVHRMKAEMSLQAEGAVVTATGRLLADILQNCAVSGEEFPVHIDEPLSLRFVPEAQAPREEELEISTEECDEIFYSGESFDLGEAVAQGLGLAIDPFARGPGADTFRQQAGILDQDTPSGPFAALAALKKD